MESDGLEGQLAHIEREAIVKALEQTRYNKTKAAELLGMSFRQLRYRVRYNKTKAAELLGMSFRQLRYRVKKLGIE